MSPSTGACFQKVNPSFWETFCEARFSGAMMASSLPAYASEVDR